jgi:hypothetical protein
MVTHAAVAKVFKMGSPFRWFFALSVAWAMVLLSATDAKADVASWFYLGGGVTSLSFDQGRTTRPFTLQAEMGMGSPPHAPVIIGGLVKSLTLFGQGTDLALTVRGASGGFVRGGFGFAIDAGAYQRWWGENSTGFLGALVLGAPFGIQLTGITEQGSNDVHSYGATLGIDFLRLTVYRTTSQNYWPNPFLPAHVGASR